MSAELHVILGASDPEMAAIRQLLKECGVAWIQAAVDGKPVHPGNAGKCDSVAPATGVSTLWVECAPATGVPAGDLVADHHKPGDPGFDAQPADFIAGSSLGQVVRILRDLGHLPPDWEWSDDLRICAAADHCLGAAYQGLCPGVTPEALAAWRAASRAAFQGREVSALVADVQAAMAVLTSAPVTDAGVRDLRSTGFVPELPEAACQLGAAFMAATQDRDGKAKIVLQAATPAQVAAFLDGTMVVGLQGVYGNPLRGFAGGYLS